MLATNDANVFEDCAIKAVYISDNLEEHVVVYCNKIVLCKNLEVSWKYVSWKCLLVSPQFHWKTIRYTNGIFHSPHTSWDSRALESDEISESFGVKLPPRRRRLSLSSINRGNVRYTYELWHCHIILSLASSAYSSYSPRVSFLNAMRLFQIYHFAKQKLS